MSNIQTDGHKELFCKECNKPIDQVIDNKKLCRECYDNWRKQEGTLSIYQSEPPASENWEVGTFLLRAETKEELDAALDYLKRKYIKSVFTVSHIPQRNRKYYHAYVLFNNPLIETKEA